MKPVVVDCGGVVWCGLQLHSALPGLPADPVGTPALGAGNADRPQQPLAYLILCRRLGFAARMHAALYLEREVKGRVEGGLTDGFSPVRL